MIAALVRAPGRAHAVLAAAWFAGSTTKSAMSAGVALPTLAVRAATTARTSGRVAFGLLATVTKCAHAYIGEAMGAGVTCYAPWLNATRARGAVAVARSRAVARLRI